jgi:hypothetical protein
MLRFKSGAQEGCTLMDKPGPSRKQNFGWRVLFLLGVFLLTLANRSSAAINLSHAEAMQIGKKVWQNECNGTVSGLTSWNVGENFASLGIGHFIWYPEGMPGPFEESFPPLVRFIAAHGAKLPNLLLTTGDLHCPWRSRTEFLRAQQTPQMKQLRQFLVDTIDLQAQFLVNRLQNALPKMLQETAPSDQPKIEQRFQRLSDSSRGCFALVDYVNFKGEGVLHTERYQGQGWGLLQVLEQMAETDTDTVASFSRAAVEVLKRRVQNAPPERKESRWLPGWIQRVNSYSRS